MLQPELSALSIAERYARVSERFGQVVAGVADWHAPTPVPEWRAHDIVDHLVGWLPAMLAAKSDVIIEVPETDDPIVAWHSLDESVREILGDEAIASLEYRGEPASRIDEVIDRFFSTDVFMHTWDLARSSGQPLTLDQRYAAELLENMYPAEAAMRDSGHFGEAFPVAGAISAQDALLAFIGRDPYWRAEALVD